MEEHQPPITLDRPGSGGPAPDPEPLDDPRVLQILSTEHWGLLSARSLVYNEAFARAGMYLTFLSASLVALALAGQALAFDRTFLVLAGALLVFDVVIGLATFGRMLDATLDDLRAIQGMNRIRNGYAQVAPVTRPYLGGSIHDDAPGVMATYGGLATQRSRRQAMIHGQTTSAGMISTIVALLTGALGADAALLASLDPIIVAAAAVPAFVVTFLLLARHSLRTIRGFEATIKATFPTPTAD